MPLFGFSFNAFWIYGTLRIRPVVLTFSSPFGICLLLLVLQ